MPKINDKQLNQYFTSNGAYNPIYDDAKKLYDELRIHAEGIYPEKLLNKRRPNEPEEIQIYRKETYEAITKIAISKVTSCFGKIRRSPDWMIKFHKDVKPSGKITQEESLEEYCESKIPGFGSITNWAFDILLSQYLIDANAVVAVIPSEEILNTEFAKPVPIIFNSDQVIYFSESEKMAILKSKVKSRYQPESGTYAIGERFYYIDENEIIVFEQKAGGYQQVFYQANVMGKFPVFKVKSESYKQYDSCSLNRSRLHAMVPFLNKAAVQDNDYEGSSVQHKYPLFWYYNNQECNSCGGKGKLAAGDGPPAECKSCAGSGKMKFSPFAHLQVNSAGLGMQANPIPPAGFIAKDTNILEMMEKGVDKNIYRAYCTMNMQFLDQTPLSISGDAKRVDQEELNNTVYTSAEDIVYSVDRVIYFMNEWRYYYVVPSEATRKEMLPEIPVPQTFDLLPADYLLKEVTDARAAKVNPLLIGTMEQQLAAKKFYNQPQLAKYIELYYDLDPLPGYTPDEKMSLLSNNGITKEDYIISSYMTPFLKRAVREDAKFCEKQYTEQMAILIKYAKEKLTATDAAAAMIDQQKQKVLDEMKQQQQQQSGN
jgi:hypothetical protein